MVGRQAGDVGVDVALELEAPRHAGVDESFEGAKDGRSTDTRHPSPQVAIELLGRQLAARRRQRVSDEEPLASDPLTRGAETIRSCQAGSIHEQRLAQARLGIMSGMSESPGGLVLRGVSAGYGAGVVLHDVDLAIPPGTLVGVIGPNGSGKSTLLKAILGLAPLATGTVMLDGSPVSGQRDRLAYVPQREAVDWSFPVSAEQVVMMGRYPRVGWLRLPGGRDRIAVRDALERVALADLGAAQIGALSGGQQQRVFLARALVQEASVLLLDEPMTGVDQTTEELIVSLLQELRDGGTMILHATHDLESAAAISDQLCFVNRRVVAYGPPAETFVPSVLHSTFGGELLIVQAGDHSHVHGGGHHGPVDQ
jgi:manganese/zinc/iron transport system ATP- binding protein